VQLKETLKMLKGDLSDRSKDKKEKKISLNSLLNNYKEMLKDSTNTSNLLMIA
jgi:hypothetical protein